jgi:hypothetical protein
MILFGFLTWWPFGIAGLALLFIGWAVPPQQPQQTACQVPCPYAQNVNSMDDQKNFALPVALQALKIHNIVVNAVKNS